MAEEEKKQPKILVVKDLPQVQTREVTDGNEEYNCMTVEEAMTEVLEIVRELKKKLD